jgi:hypothetical protein
MILPREKAQVVLVFAGLALLGMTLALVQPGARGSAVNIPAQNRGVGFWKEHGISVEAGRKIGPWSAAAGIASLVAAFAIRER